MLECLGLVLLACVLAFAFGAYFYALIAKRPKNSQQFIVKNDELYEYDSESRRYYPWKSSVPKQ
jgi:ABC-type branched-subunit amino acid transport system permease subunit